MGRRRSLCQSETEVADLADLTAVVIQPGSGDALQLLKAGLTELFDVLVVNKSLLGPLADAARRELVSALRVMGRRDATVIMTSALTDAGITSLIEHLENRDIQGDHLEAALVHLVASDHLAWRGLERVAAEGGPEALRARLAAVRPLTPTTLLAAR